MRRAILPCAAIWMTASFTASAAVEWTTLTNCVLIANPYNDGDSFHVRQGDREYIFRLYFVDAPEDDEGFPQRVDEQARYFGVERENIIQTGLAARDATQELLSEPFTVITRWHTAQGRSKIPRFYAFVHVGEKDLAQELVSRGLARVYGVRTQTPDGEKSTVFRSNLLKLEDEARHTGVGAWEFSDPIAIKKKRRAGLPVVVAPRTVAAYSEALPRRRVGEIQRGEQVRILLEKPDGWVQVEYDLPDGQTNEVMCLRWDLSLPDYVAPTNTPPPAAPESNAGAPLTDTP